MTGSIRIGTSGWVYGHWRGPILYQIAPQVPAEPERPAAFAALLPREHTHVFEFRDARWFTPETRDVLARANLAFCIHDAHGVGCPDWVTANTVYYRFHGPPDSPAYTRSYSNDALQRAARDIAARAAAGHDVCVYFNNDLHGHAVTNAARLIELTG